MHFYENVIIIGNLFFYFFFLFPNIKSIVCPIAIECIELYFEIFLYDISVYKKKYVYNLNTYYYYVLKDGL